MGSRIFAALSLVLFAGVASGCGSEQGETLTTIGLAADGKLPFRQGSVLVDGCAIDPWQANVLARPETRRVVTEVILLCLVPRADGTIGPADDSARSELGRVTAQIHEAGYTVSLGVAFTDETGARYDGERTALLVGDAAFRSRFTASLAVFAPNVDAFDLDLQGVPERVRQDVTKLVQETRAALVGKTLGVFVPPSVADPSDLPEGDSVDRRAIATSVDRFRVMTLDYSEANGPTIDTGWAVDAVRLALASKPGGRVDVSLPLYGVDFGPRGARGVSVLEARGLELTHARQPMRSPSGALHFEYVTGGEAHQVWYDDAVSTGDALGAFATSLPPDVGVLYYGFGAEDPDLFSKIAARIE